MSERNQLYELTRLIGDRSQLDQEVAEVFSVLRDTLQKRYVGKLHSAAEFEKRHAMEHTPREITLMKALREFTQEEQRPGIDRAIEMAFLMNTMQKVQEDLSSIAEEARPIYKMDDASIDPSKAQEMESKYSSARSSATVTGALLALALFHKI